MADYKALLAALRSVESGGNYKSPPKGGTASGAYQFTDSTWLANGGGRFAPHAYQATPDQQDLIAEVKIKPLLVQGGSDDAITRRVADVWYIGHVASPAELDKVPHPEAGNKLTVRQYEDKLIASVGHHDSVVDTVGSAAGDAAGAVANAVAGVLGDLASPFLEGLRRLSIIGLSVTLGIGLIGLGAWRSVRASG